MRIYVWTRLLCFVFITGASLNAQQKGSQSAKPATSPLTVAIPSTGFPGLDKYRASRIEVYLDDFGQLARYRDANKALNPPAPGENRVVFFGDSITDMWHLEESFPNKPYLNRGIGGQTTSQMLVRFRQDVIDLRPKAVIILAGTNDIAGNSGPISNEDIEANLADFADQAFASGPHRAAPFANHKVAESQHGDRQHRCGARDDPSIDREVGLAGIDQQQRTDDERDHAADTEDTVARDEHLGHQQPDADQHQQQPGKIDRQD